MKKLLFIFLFLSFSISWIGSASAFNWKFWSPKSDEKPLLDLKENKKKDTPSIPKSTSGCPEGCVGPRGLQGPPGESGADGRDGRDGNRIKLITYYSPFPMSGSSAEGSIVSAEFRPGLGEIPPEGNKQGLIFIKGVARLVDTSRSTHVNTCRYRVYATQPSLEGSSSRYETMLLEFELEPGVFHQRQENTVMFFTGEITDHSSIGGSEITVRPEINFTDIKAELGSTGVYCMRAEITIDQYSVIYWNSDYSE